MSLIEGLTGLDALPRFLIAFVLVLMAIGAVAWTIRRLTGRGDLDITGRGRQPRLGVLEALAIDQRRRLVLVRRDNIEHLILIGGPADLVVEAAIMRGAPAAVAEAARAAQQQARGPAGRQAARPAGGDQQASVPAVPVAAPPQAAPPAPPPEAVAEPAAPRPQRPAQRRPAPEAPPRAASPQLHAVGSERPAPPSGGGDRAPAPAPRRGGDTGLTATASALEQALRRPFGGGRASSEAEIVEPDADPRAEPRAEGRPPRRVEQPASQARPERAQPVEREERDPPPNPQPQRLVAEAGQGRGTATPAEPRPLQAPRERPAPMAERPREAPPAPGPNAGPGPGAQAPQPPSLPRAVSPFPGGPGAPARPSPERPTLTPLPSRGPARAAPEAAENRGPREAPEPKEIVISKQDRPVPVSLEDEMANLLDEIAGGRERS